MARLSALCLVALLAGAVVAGPAAADDTSLREAGKSRDAAFERLGKAEGRAARAWVRSGYSRARARPLIRILRRLRGELDRVAAALRPEQPSSDGGATYKRLLLRSIRNFDGSLAARIRGVRAGTARKPVLRRRAFKRADRLLDRAARLEERAIKAITSG